MNRLPQHGVMHRVAACLALAAILLFGQSDRPFALCIAPGHVQIEPADGHHPLDRTFATPSGGLAMAAQTGSLASLSCASGSGCRDLPLDATATLHQARPDLAPIAVTDTPPFVTVNLAAPRSGTVRIAVPRGPPTNPGTPPDRRFDRLLI